jgi:opacity protein-like surface antigen
MAPSALEAQADKKGEGELSAYAGAVFGMGAHPAVGGSTGTAFSRYATELIDISYMPLNRDTLLSSPLAAAYRGSGLYDFALCTNVQIPIGRRWAPYGILGIGLLYNVYQAAVLTPAGAGYADRSKTNFEFSTGGGVRYYVADNWGIRPEVRVFISGRNFTRISVGVFYDIDADWPFRIRRNSKSSRSWPHLP